MQKKWVRDLVVLVMLLAGLCWVAASGGTAVAQNQSASSDDFHTCDPTAANIIWGTDGDDLLTGTPGDDVIFALAGNDRIYGLGGSDCIVAGAGDDVVWGHAGDDIIFGQAGDDRISGGHGFDRLSGGTGDDRLLGDFGPDFMDGGEGEDVLDGRSADNICQNGERDRRCMVHSPLANTGQFAAVIDLEAPAAFDFLLPQAGQPVIVSGVSQNLPVGGGMWLLVRPYGLDKFYPQYNASCADAQPITAENWQVTAYLGLPGDLPEWFDIVVIAADADASAMLQAHILTHCGSDPGLDRETLEMHQITEVGFVTIRTR